MLSKIAIAFWSIRRTLYYAMIILFPLTHPKIRPACFVDSMLVEMDKYIKPIFATENVANWAVFCIINMIECLRVSYVVNALHEKELVQVAERQESVHKFIQY